MPPDLDRAVLEVHEVWWRDHQKWFQECGYMLRPRYMPDWKPSWLDKEDNLFFFREDAQILWVRFVDLFGFHFCAYYAYIGLN